MELVYAGRSLLLRETAIAMPHVWFILTDPHGTPPRVVAVMLRTARHYTDTTVVLMVGDHPFVRHESSVHYSSARYFTVSALEHAHRLGRCSLQADMSRALLANARDGLLRSPFTVNAVREFCRGRFAPPAEREIHGDDDAR